MKLLVFLLVLCVAVIAQRRASPFGKGVFVEGRVSKRHNNGPSSMGSIPFHVPNHYRVVKRMPYRIPIYENLPHFNKVQYATQKPYLQHPMAIPVPRPEAPFKQIDLAAADIQPQYPKNRIIVPAGSSQYTERPYDYGHHPLINSAPFKGSPRINYYAPQQSDVKQYKPQSQSIIYNYSKQQYPQTPVNQMPEYAINSQENYQKQHGYIPETSQHLTSQDHFVPINQNNKNNQDQFGINYVPKSQSSKDTETSRPSIIDTNYLQYKNNNYGVSYQQPQKESIYKQELVKPVSTKPAQESIVGTNTHLQYLNQLGLSYQQPQVQSNYKQEAISPVTTKASNIGTNTQLHYNQNQLGVSYQQPQVESSYKQEIGKPVETKASNIAINAQFQYNQNQFGVSYQQPQVESNYKQEIANSVAIKPSNIGTNTKYNYNQNQLGLSYQQPQVKSNYKQEITSPGSTKSTNVGNNPELHYTQNQLGINYQQPQEESSYKQGTVTPVLTKTSNVESNTKFHYIQNQLGINYQQPQVTASYKIEEPKSLQSYINETPYKSDNSEDGLCTTSSFTGSNVQIGNNQVGMVFKQPQMTTGYQIKEPQEPYNFESQYKNFAKLTADDGIRKANQKVYNNQQQLGATYSQHQASASDKIEEPKSQSYNIGNQYETIYPQGNVDTKLDGYRNIFTGKYDQPQVSASYKIEEPKVQEPYNSVTLSSGFGKDIYPQQQTNQQQSWKPSITNYELSEGYISTKTNDHIYYQTPPEYQTQAPILEVYKKSANHEEPKSHESSINDYKHQSNLQGSVVEYGKQHEKNTDSSVISVTLDTNHYRPNVYQQKNPLNEKSSQHFSYFGQDDGLSKSSNQEVQVNNPVNSNSYKTEGAYNSNSANYDGSVQNIKQFSPIVAKEVEDQVYQQQDVTSYQNQATSGISAWGSERSNEENWKIVDPPKAETLSWKRSSYDMNAEDWLKMKEQHDVSSHMLRQGVQQADTQEEHRMDSTEKRGTRPVSTMAEERMSYPVHFLVSPEKEQLKGNNINFVPQESVPTPTGR